MRQNSPVSSSSSAAPLPDHPPVSGAVLLIGGLLALAAIAGAVVLAFSGTQTIQSGIRTQMLREISRQLPPVTGARLLFSGESRAPECGAALIFEVWSTSGTMESVRTSYTQQVQRLGWVLDPRTGSIYPTETTRIELVSPVPQAVGGVTIPPGVQAGTAPGSVTYVVIVTGWQGDRCPQWNRSARLKE